MGQRERRGVKEGGRKGKSGGERKRKGVNEGGGKGKSRYV